MSHLNSPFELKGDLNVELDDSFINIKCEGQCIQLTFASFKALRKFISLNRTVNQDLFPFFNQLWLSQFNFTYYLEETFIGESRPNLKPSWIGRYVGLERSKVYPFQLLSYFFNIKSSPSNS